MSRWTVIRFALAAILTVTLIGSSSAQTPNPWRIAPAPAPMPRQKVASGYQIELGIELGSGPILFGRGPGPCDCPQARAPMPQQVTNTMDVLRGFFAEEYSPCPPGISPFSLVPYPGPAGCASSLCAPPPVMTRTMPLTLNERNFAWSYQVVPSDGAGGWWLNEVRAPQAIPAGGGMGGKLAGTWCRDVGDAVITARFTGDEMVVGMTQKADGITVHVTITADYALTNEGLIHGVVTGIDLNVKPGSNTGDSPSGQEIAESGAELQKLVDCPFSFRAKLTSAGVMVSNFKIAAEGMGKEELALACGLFKPTVDGKLPTPMSMKTRATSRCEPSPCLPPAAVQVATQAIADAVPTMPPPTVPGMVVPASTAKQGCCEAPKAVLAPQAAWSPPKPVNVPPGDFGMMADVFGQMIGTPAPLPPCQLQPAAVASVVPRPLPAPPMPPVLARPISGTWVREIGPLMYVITIDNDHLTIRSTASAEVAAGKVMSEGMTITADYHLMRDGTTLLGLITSADAILEGDVPPIDDLPQLSAELDRVQKALTDKPLAMSVRVHGDTLVVGNVRLAEMEGEGPRAFPLAALGGRYTNIAGKPLSRPKPTKVNDLPHYRPTAQAPPPYYPVPTGVYLPPPIPTGWGAPAPYGDVPPRPIDYIPPPAPGSSPVYGLPAHLLMPPPTPPVIEQPTTGKKGKKKPAPSRATPTGTP